MSRRVLVLPSPPTANGDLHVGHLAGPYVGADAFARYRRMRGHRVAYVTGADVHQSYVVRMAERLGEAPRATADRFSTRIEDTLRAAEVEVDAFVRPQGSHAYQDFVAEFFVRLYQRGEILDDRFPTLWCDACGGHLLGAAVRGSCGHCGGDCDGALCEGCSHPVVAEELRNPRCTRCDGPAGLRSERRLMFPAGKYADRLREYHAEPRMRGRPHGIVQRLLDDCLPHAAVMSPNTWGVRVPVAGFEAQRLDVWAEVGPGYPASTNELSAGDGPDPGTWRDYWCTDDAEIVQFFGFDNTVPHTLLYPALYLAHGEIRPPDRFVVNEFHHLDGDKLSTSRGHAVWGGDILSRVPADEVRYYLCLTASEEENGDFTLAGFGETVNRDLADTLDPLLAEAVRGLASGEPRPSLGEGNGAPMRKIRGRADEIGRLLEPETFSLRGAVRAWRDMATELTTALASEPTPTECAREGLSLLAGCAHPLMPGFAERLWGSIGAAGDLRTHPWGEPALRWTGDVTPRAEGTWFPRVTEDQLSSLAPDPVGA